MERYSYGCMEDNMIKGGIMEEDTTVKISIEEQCFLKAMDFFESALEPKIVYSEDAIESAQSAIKVMKENILCGINELKNGTYRYWSNVEKMDDENFLIRKPMERMNEPNNK